MRKSPQKEGVSYEKSDFKGEAEQVGQKEIECRTPGRLGEIESGYTDCAGQNKI